MKEHAEGKESMTDEMMSSTDISSPEEEYRLEMQDLREKVAWVDGLRAGCGGAGLIGAVLALVLGGYSLVSLGSDLITDSVATAVPEALGAEIGDLKGELDNVSTQAAQAREAAVGAETAAARAEAAARISGGLSGTPFPAFWLEEQPDVAVVVYRSPVLHSAQASAREYRAQGHSGNIYNIGSTYLVVLHDIAMNQEGLVTAILAGVVPEDAALINLALECSFQFFVQARGYIECNSEPPEPEP